MNTQLEVSKTPHPNDLNSKALSVTVQLSSSSDRKSPPQCSPNAVPPRPRRPEPLRTITSTTYRVLRGSNGRVRAVIGSEMTIRIHILSLIVGVRRTRYVVLETSGTRVKTTPVRNRDGSSTLQSEIKVYSRTRVLKVRKYTERPVAVSLAS